MAVKTIKKKTIFCNQRTSELKALCTSQQPVLSQQFESFTRVQCLWTGVRVERGGGGISPKCPPLVDSLTPFPPSPSWRCAATSEGMGTARKEKHAGTTSPLCLAFPVCPPHVISCFKCVAFGPIRLRPEFCCPSWLVTYRTVKFSSSTCPAFPTSPTAPLTNSW